MRYGVREICDVVFKTISGGSFFGKTYSAGQPVLYIDSAKTSTLEGASTSVYATGGRGNTRLITWEGEKTLTFTVEDALLSPISFAVLSGAGLLSSSDNTDETVFVHMTAEDVVGEGGLVDLTNFLEQNDEVSDNGLFALAVDQDGSLTGDTYKASVNTADAKKITVTTDGTTVLGAGTKVFIDFYVEKAAANVSELQIDAENFAGYFYVEANTLFRRQQDGVDAPVVITLPKVKIQSNFSFAMAATGDPSTFTFTMDAMPGYTMFDRTKRVLCVMQIVGDTTKKDASSSSVMDEWAEYEDAE